MVVEPTFELEEQYWSERIAIIAGIDEAGMGAWAGPVVAGAVVFDLERIKRQELRIEDTTIRDSKRLTAKKREEAAKWIQEHATSWAIGEASVVEISALNIRKASHLAMQRAVDALKPIPEFLLVDGTTDQVHPLIPAINVIKGDSKSLSIAAASILAKVHRDGLMVNIEMEFPGYGFAGHKGYGTAEHRVAMKKLGVIPHHRSTYAPVAEMLSK